MNRRSFLAGSACVLGTLASDHLFGDEAAAQLPIHIDLSRSRTSIPPDFTGLGFEISSVAIPNLLSPENHAYIKLVRGLGSQGVIRIGGNTSDFSSFRPGGKLVSKPKATVVNSESLRALGRFLDATGWKLIWGLNLGSGTAQQATEEAQAVAAAAGNNLLAFEIGNEPDLFVQSGHRPGGYSYEQYLQEYRRYKTAIRSRLPAAPLAGPDAARATDWAVRFAKDEGHDLKLLTHHYYRGGARNPNSSLDELLRPDTKLGEMLEAMRAASREAGIPYRIVETNSFAGGGKPGVSDTFGSALWTLDFMLTLAAHGAAGFNLETGMNQLDFISSYSPIMDDQHGHYTAAPDYYGMLAFAPLSGGELLAPEYDASNLNATVYAVRRDREILVAIINKDGTRAAQATIAAGNHSHHATAIRLSGPSLDSKTGVTLGATGQGGDKSPDPIRTKGGYSLRVPAGSAAIVRLSR